MDLTIRLRFTGDAGADAVIAHLFETYNDDGSLVDAWIGPDPALLDALADLVRDHEARFGPATPACGGCAGCRGRAALDAARA